MKNYIIKNDKPRTTVTNKMTKFISTILILSMFAPVVFLSAPKKAEAAWWSTFISDIETGITAAFGGVEAGSTVTNTAISVKNVAKEIYKQALMAIARRLLQEITKGVVTWINTGFHGAPLFLENPESFFQDIAKTEVKTLVDQFGYDSLKYPFGKDFALNTINAYKKQLSDNTAYSLSKVMTDPVQLRNYQNNFNVGGWDAFLINTQYPQNNYLGFQMLATEELARRVQGTTQTAAQKVQTTLQQGQGFLSPEKCMDEGTTYNDTMANAWQRPSFNQAEFNKNNKYTCNDDFPNDDNGWKACNDAWKEKLETEKNKWAKDNTCKNLVATTPGTVIADQIKINLGSGVRQTELAAAMGNSLSVIFDALLNKLIGDGLNSLASNKNSKPVEDNWSYNGLTLGSPTEGGTNSSWNSGPDEEIILDKFKKQLHGKTIVTTIKADGSEEVTEEIGNTNTAQITRGTYIPGDIANTETEIILLDLIPKTINNRDNANPGIAQLAQTLDQCMPGPDKNWEGRLKDEESRVGKSLLMENNVDSDELKAKAAADALRELKFAVSSFKDWLTTKIMTELPGSILYMDVLKSIDDFPQQTKEAANRRSAKLQTLARLKAIAGDEKSVQKTGLAAISSQPAPGSNEEKTLILLKKQYNVLAASISSSASVEETIAELDSLKDRSLDIKNLIAQCKTEVEVAGWKITQEEKSILENTDDNTYGAPVARRIEREQNGVTETEKFCSIPIVSGYSHGEIIREDSSNRGKDFTFRNEENKLGNEGFQDIPIVNAENVYGDITCTGTCSWLGGSGTDKRVSVKIDCNTIFKANIIDYTHAGDPAN